jgi:hypothetical protein
MGNFSRRDFVRLFAMAVGGTILSPQSAKAQESDAQYVAFSPSLAIEIADMFSENCIDDRPEASNPIPLINSSGKQIGWSVDYILDGQPSGYILLDTTTDGLVSRYSTHPGTTNLYETASTSYRTSLRSINNSPVIVKESPLDFGAFDEASLSSYDQYGGVIRLSARPTSWDDLMINFSELFGNPYTIIDSDDLGDYWFLTEEQIKRHTGKYACAVTALFTIAGLTQFGNRFLIDTTSEYTSNWDAYDKLWTATATLNSGYKNGCTYGYTLYDMIGPGFTNYCLTQHAYAQGNSGKYSPTIDDFKASVARKRHSVFSANILKSNGEKDGHVMAVSGWRTLSGAGSTLNGLVVYDGWSDMVFLNTSFNGYVSTYGTFF